MAGKPFQGVLVVIKGSGELGSGVAYRLAQAGFQLVMTDLERPSCVCHTASFSEAISAGRKELAGQVAVRAESGREALAVVAAGTIAVMADPTGTVVGELAPTVVVDAVMAKRNLGTTASEAPIVIGLGPGFAAGQDVHAVVETKRGHQLGWVIRNGSAEANTGIPEPIDGQTMSRLLTAPADGKLAIRQGIGQRVHAGEVVASVQGRPVEAAISGVVRGLLPDGYMVAGGDTIGDVDPAAEPEYCCTISDRALAVGGGVLAAVLELWPDIPESAGPLPRRQRGRRPASAPGGEILGPAEFALLGLLTERPAHGYELSKAFGDGELGAVIRLGLSQLYADLAKLESLGLVEARQAEHEQPRRKLYAPTSSGARQFGLWVSRPVPKVRYLRLDFMAKLYFAQRAGDGRARQLIADQIEVVRWEVDSLRSRDVPGGFRQEIALAREDFALAALKWLQRLAQQRSAGCI